ncbi:MAG: coenzyme F420-0:L-glutamate ligase [Candidatus Gracilibacteria bacterium]
MQIIPIKTRKIYPEDSLLEVFAEGLKKAQVKLQDGDIVAVVSKVVALTEGGLVNLGSTEGGSKKNLRSLVTKEADVIISPRSADFMLTMKNGILTPNSGIDQSNVPEGHAILWPRDAYDSAEKMRVTFKKFFGSKQASLKKIGILIFDSCVMPLRNGVVGVALGYSGFYGVEDYRGKRDLCGKVLRVTQKNIADGLATAATLVTGEGAESVPFVVIRGAPVKWVGRGSADSRDIRENPGEIKRAPNDCLYRELYPAKLLNASGGKSS